MKIVVDYNEARNVNLLIINLIAYIIIVLNDFYRMNKTNITFIRYYYFMNYELCL